MTERARLVCTGFTLLEILITLFIFALVIIGVLGVYRQTLTEIDVLTDETRLLDTARSCMARISQDLQSLHVTLAPTYAPPDPGGPADMYRFVAGRDHLAAAVYGNLRFATRTHLAFEAFPPGIAVVRYFADRGTDGAIVLRRAWNLLPYQPSPATLDDDVWPVVCKNITELTFRFFDHQGNPHATWDSEDRILRHATPRAVEITLELGHDHIRQRLQTRLALPLQRPPAP